MKKLACWVLFFFVMNISFAQVICNATSDSGSGYDAFNAVGIEIENPDCEHTTFGAHITQEYDELLLKNVFRFHSHIVEDNDRCQVFDRVRMEIKGGPNSNEELKHPNNSLSYYRWKFKIPNDFLGSSNFCHIFQNKAVGGDDTSFPIITITLRASVLQLLHNGGETGIDLGTLAQVDLDLFRGQWVEVFMEQLHGQNGVMNMSIRNMNTGDIIFSYSNDDIDLWREGAEYNRPKWGMYRLKNNILKDEYILFSDFCVSESSASLCPEDTNLIVDSEAPTQPLNLVASNISINSATLSWDASSDNIAVEAYKLFQDNVEIWSGSQTSYNVTNLMGSTTYDFYVVAYDASNNASDPSNILEVTTEDILSLPTPATMPFPANNSTNVNTTLNLNWISGTNTDSFKVYLGTNNDPPLVQTTNATNYEVNLDEETKYFWKVVSVNSNGEIMSSLWTFTTGLLNADAPWALFRGNNRPEIETTYWELNAEPASPLVDESVDDPNGSNNKFYNFRDDKEGNFRWRYRFLESDTSLTAVIRFKAIDPDLNGVIYFETRGFGWREKIRIDQKTIKFEKSVPLVEVPLPFDLSKEFHRIRIVMKGQVTTVYFDENPEPFASAIAGEENNSEFFEWGKSGTSEYGASIDWIAIVINNDWSPSEGADLPVDLIKSSDANLVDLKVNGLTIEGFDPCVYEYTIGVTGTVVPTLEWTESSAISVATVTYPATVPNTNATVQVLSDDGLTSKTYIVNFIESVSVVDNEWDQKIRIYPNPSSRFLNIEMDGDEKMQVLIQDLSGKKVLEKAISGSTYINLESLENGVFNVVFIQNEKIIFSKKLIHLRN